MADTTATVSTPVAAPPAPAAPEVPSSPGPTPKNNHSAIAPQKVLVKTKVSPRAFASQVAAAAASQGVPVVAQPVTTETVATEPVSEVDEVAVPATASTDADTAAAPPAKPGAVQQGSVDDAEIADGAEPAAAAAKPEVDASELTKRMAKLNRKERALQADVGIAAELRALVGPEHATRDTIRTLVQRVRMIENSRAAAMADPAGFLEQAFGVPRQHTADRAINHLIGDAAKTPEQKQREALDADLADRKARLDAYERQLAQAANRQQAGVTESQARAYISGTIEPLLANSEAYKFTRAELGDRASAEIWNTMVVRFNKTKQTPSAKEVADHFEKTYRQKAAKAAALLGASVNPSKPVSPSRTEPLPAKRPAPQTRNVPQPNPALRRGGAKPYTIKIVG